MKFTEKFGNNVLMIELEKDDTNKQKRIAVSLFNLIKALTEEDKNEYVK